MTWAEYRIRLHAYLRISKREMLLIRELSWVTYVAPHLNHKSMKKSIDGFWPLKKSAKATNAMIERMREVQNQYKLDVEELNLKTNKNG